MGGSGDASGLVGDGLAASRASGGGSKSAAAALPRNTAAFGASMSSGGGVLCGCAGKDFQAMARGRHVVDGA